MIEAVVFDMDGLLIDSEPLWQQAEIEVFARVGIQLDAQLCLRTRGRKIDEVVDYWHAQAPWRSPPRREVREAIVERVAELIAQAGTSKPGVEHALDFFAARSLPLALASSSPYRLIDAVLTRLHIEDRFDVLHSGEEERLGKPDPAIFLSAARKLGVAPARCLAFEDSPGGVASAKAAGMRCVAVPDAAGAGASRFVEERAALARVADLVIDSLLDFETRHWRRLASAGDA